MAKTITLERTEYCTEWYRVTWTENDYKDFLKWLGDSTIDSNKKRYEVLKDVSWETIVDIVNGERDDIYVEEKSYDGDETYKASMSEFIVDAMREDCWNIGCVDSECYDSEEFLSVDENFFN